MSVSALILRLDQAERRVCLFANAISRRAVCRGLFQKVSRLGDGIFWYSLIASMPLILGEAGWMVGARMVIAGTCGLIIYKVLKRTLVRERPFIGLIGIECAMPPLDRYSLPSGHTLHAVLLSTIAINYAPVLAFLLVPFTLMVAVSRVVLGLHYPTDVIAGAVLGAAIAQVFI